MGAHWWRRGPLQRFRQASLVYIVELLLCFVFAVKLLASEKSVGSW